ncbi:MAG TPA: N-acetyl-gamma-glutamyl-phosphate reductase, partial [Gammaproteobacteria bacterium]|nr:N-acetyl-gamma-glutamyl-phosphate reductase [Gammaproteobacteria bacterium]
MIKVGIVGGTGYTGVELLRLLAVHPHVEVAAVTSRAESGRAVADLFPSLRGQIDIAFSEPDAAVLHGCDLVFYATPNGIAMQSTPELLQAGVRVIDLAADFRIQEQALWEEWYGMSHACPELLPQAVYGLPEIHRDKIASASLVANPGCYPTATILGFLPLLEAGVVDPGSLI